MPAKITLDELSLLACKFGLTLADLQTIYEVETNGSGILPDGRPKILFERHYFSKFTNGVYDTLHPDISNKLTGGYKGPIGEWNRFDKAANLNGKKTREAAIMSCSWGVGQIMGSHYKDLGFETPQDFLNQNWKGEYEQFEIMLSFLTLPKNRTMFHALKEKDWATFAKLYNGPKYKINNYDSKLATAYEKHSNLIA